MCVDADCALLCGRNETHLQPSSGSTPAVLPGTARRLHGFVQNAPRACSPLAIEAHCTTQTDTTSKQGHNACTMQRTQVASSTHRQLRKNTGPYKHTGSHRESSTCWHYGIPAVGDPATRCSSTTTAAPAASRFCANVIRPVLPSEHLDQVPSLDDSAVGSRKNSGRCDVSSILPCQPFRLGQLPRV